MWIQSFPESCPKLFWGVAAVWSVGQGIAGFQYGDYIYEKSRPHISTLVRWIYGLHHAALYVVSSFSGFVAWRLLSSWNLSVTEWSELSGGVATVSVGIAAFVVVAISGALARILYLGTKPW